MAFSPKTSQSEQPFECALSPSLVSDCLSGEQPEKEEVAPVMSAAPRKQEAKGQVFQPPAPSAGPVVSPCRPAIDTPTPCCPLSSVVLHLFSLFSSVY